MKSFVERTRHDIVEWWERCMKSEDERAWFTTFLLQDVNEDMLKLHERELDSLKQFYGENDQIFQMVLQRQEIWDRMLALEYKSNDPTRYNNRRGKLMEEEKHGRKFTVYGTPEEELIEEQWMQREESKHQQSSARKKANGVLGVSTVGRTSNRVADFDGQMLLQRFWLKRKLATPTNSKMHAKPLLLRELNSPDAGVNRTETAKLSLAKNKVPNRSSVVLKKQRTRLHQQRMVEPIKPLPSDTSLMEGEENVEPMPHLAPMLSPAPMSFSHSPAAAGSLSMLARSPGVANSTSIGNTTWGD
uniref:uncharacterized protein LOC125908395 n=1 Tax=Anopheles coluzzii TaxID=1518534 RepID=UPI0020FF825F|nr:uncharacterized protein LOC125908395 [Anopheles coluzzii]